VSSEKIQLHRMCKLPQLLQQIVKSALLRNSTFLIESSEFIESIIRKEALVV
jgi:hypothetical protein